MSALINHTADRLPYFAKESIPGIDLWHVAQAFEALTPFSETGQSYESAVRVTDHVQVRRDPNVVKVNLGWGELRADGAPGRAFTVTATTAGAPTRVYIARADTNYSPKLKGWGRATLVFAAKVAAPLNAPISVCGTEDGAAAWLALGAQPNEEEHKALIAKMEHSTTSRIAMKHVRRRDYTGLRRVDSAEFEKVVNLLRPWSGEWSAEKAQKIAAQFQTDGPGQ